MLKQLTLTTVFAIATIGVSAHAASNPLHPSFRYGADVAQTMADGSNVFDVRSLSPLTPSFYAARSNASPASGQAWFDATASNPLHPNFHRS